MYEDKYVCIHTLYERIILHVTQFILGHGSKYYPCVFQKRFKKHKEFQYYKGKEATDVTAAFGCLIVWLISWVFK